jgi:hypothetical protein
MPIVERRLEPVPDEPVSSDLPLCAYCDESLDPAVVSAFEAGVGPVCWEQSRPPLGDGEDSRVRAIVRRLRGIRRAQAETLVLLLPDYRTLSGVANS